MKKEPLSAIKDVILYFVKWLLNSGAITIPCLYLLWRLATHKTDAEPPETLLRIHGLLWSFVIGCMASTFYRSYVKRKLDDNTLDASPSNQKREEVSFRILKWDFPLWKILHWVFVVCFLILTCWIMHDGLASLFLKVDLPTQVFEWFFSILIGLTLFWLVYMITRGKGVIAYSAFYLVVLFAPLTMNFFHFYNNISQTQRMDTAVKYSHAFVEKTGKRISNGIAAKTDSLQTSIRDKALDLEKKISDNEIEIRSLPQRTPIKRADVRENEIIEYQADEKNPRIISLERQNRNHETALKKLLASPDWNVVQRLNAGLFHLKQADSICIEINKEYEVFNDTKTAKEDQLKIRNNIVKKINELYGSLEKAKILDKTDEITWKIITMPNTNRIESIGKLFEFFTELFSPHPRSATNEAKDEYHEVRQIEKRLIIMSLSMSLLIDITPLIMGLLVAFSHTKEN